MSMNPDYGSYDEYVKSTKSKNDDLPDDSYKDTDPEDSYSKKGKNKVAGDMAEELDKSSDDDSEDSNEESVSLSEKSTGGESVVKQSFGDKIKSMFGSSNPAAMVQGNIASYASNLAAKYHIPIKTIYIVAVLMGCTALTSVFGFLFPNEIEEIGKVLGAANIQYNDHLNNTEIEERVRDPRYIGFNIYSMLSSPNITAEYINAYDLDEEQKDTEGDASSDPYNKDNWDNDEIDYSVDNTKLGTEEYFDKYYEEHKEGRGFSDECIVGLLSNMEAESGVNSYAFEADYVIKNLLADENAKPDGKKLILCNTHHYNWDAYTPALFDYYSTQGVAIDKSGYEYTITKSDGSEEKHYYPGVGLIGFTGQNAYRLQTYCDTFDDPYCLNQDGHNDAMYTVDGQLSFMIYDAPNQNQLTVQCPSSADALNSILNVTSVTDDQLVDEWMKAAYDEAIYRYEKVSKSYWWQSEDDRKYFREEVQKKWEEEIGGVLEKGTVSVPFPVWATFQRFNYCWRSVTYASDIDKSVSITLKSGSYLHNASDDNPYEDSRAAKLGLTITTAPEPNYKARFEGDSFEATSYWDDWGYEFPGPQWTDNGFHSATPTCCGSSADAIIEIIDGHGTKFENLDLSFHDTLYVSEDVRLECMLYDQWGRLMKSQEEGIEDKELEGVYQKDVIIEASWSDEEIDGWNQMVYANTDPVNIELDTSKKDLWRVAYDYERCYEEYIKHYSQDCVCGDYGPPLNLCCGQVGACEDCKKIRADVVAWCKARRDIWKDVRLKAQDEMELYSSNIYIRLKSWICCNNEDKGYTDGCSNANKPNGKSAGNDWDLKHSVTRDGSVQIPLHSHFYDDETSKSGNPVYKVYSIRAEASKLMAYELTTQFIGPGSNQQIIAQHYTHCDDWATEQHAFYHTETFQDYGWCWLPNDQLAKGICQVGCSEYNNAMLWDMKRSLGVDDLNGTMQNMTPAEMAVAMAYPKGHESLGNIRSDTLDVDDCYYKRFCTSLYIAVKDIVCPEDMGILYSSCDRGLATSVRAGGADDFFPLRVKDLPESERPANADEDDSWRGIASYCDKYSEVEEDGIRWRRVYSDGKDYWDGSNNPLGTASVTIHGETVAAKPFNDESLFDALQPGDILVKYTGTSSGGDGYGGGSAHVVMYVGQDVVQDKWPLLCNYSEDGAKTAVVHASHMKPEEVKAFGEVDAARGLRCDPDGTFITDDGQYCVYRAVTQNYDSSRWKWKVESLRNYLESLPNGIGNDIISEILKDPNSIF